MKKSADEFKLLITDIDNTLFDWVSYYVHAFSALLEHVSNHINVPYEQLAAEARQVFSKHESIEYPFLAQELKSVNEFFGDNLEDMLETLVRPARQKFLAVAEDYLQPYAGVDSSLKKLRERRPDIPVVALTDAPRYVAMWKLNKLGLLSHFDAVYGLPDPRLPILEPPPLEPAPLEEKMGVSSHSGEPTSQGLAKVKVETEILLKHLKQNDFGFQGKIRVLPGEYEKPGTRGLKTILMDYQLDEDPEHRNSVLWIGDNVRKDIGLGHRVGVRTGWAAYGAKLSPELFTKLHQFSPPDNIHKNANLTDSSPNADYILDTFDQILPILI